MWFTNGESFGRLIELSAIPIKRNETLTHTDVKSKFVFEPKLWKFSKG